MQIDKRFWGILEWLSQSPNLNATENLWWDLKKALVAHKLNISELEANAREEWTKIPLEHFQKLVSLYASCLNQVTTVNRCTSKYEDACHEPVNLEKQRFNSCVEQF